MREFIERIIELPTRKVVLFLTATMLICGSITSVLIHGFRAQGAPSAFGDWESYTEEWRIPLEQKMQLSVAGHAIDLLITFHNGSDIIARFEGQRPSENYAVYTTVTKDKITFRENTHPEGESSTGFNFQFIDNTQHLVGLLELSLPDSLIGAMEVTLLSGNIDISDSRTENLKLSTSSGSVLFRNGLCEGDIDISSFSGSISIDNLQANHGKVSSSSGSITADNLRLLSLQNDQFSAWSRYSNVNVDQSMVFSTSSGDLFIGDFTAESLKINGFSGHLSLQNGSLTQSLFVDSSSGAIDMVQVGAEEITTKSFSGYHRVEELNTQKLTAESSSGDLFYHLLNNADIDCSTFSGDVELNLLEDASFKLELDTFSGSIDIAYPLTMSGSNGNKNMSGTVGNGEHSIKVSTSSGDIVIQPYWD